jgi:DNA mismatch endonuclease (patch repair protein)
MTRGQAGETTTSARTTAEVPADIVSSAGRSRIMSRIKGRDTKPELVVRHYLHRCGFRYRLHDADLPGRPDIVLPRYGAVILVHGCFWHRHEGCADATTPGTNCDFWRTKFSANMARDQRTSQQLLDAGWRVAVVWECVVRRAAQHLTALARLEKWIRGRRKRAEFP